MTRSGVKYLGLIVSLCSLVVYVQGRPQDINTPTTPVTEKSTWNKIKDGVEHGFNVAYDEVHCGFHKVKELVKHHDHDGGSDPCVNKPYQQTTTSTSKPLGIDLRIIDDMVPITTIRP